MFRLLVILVTWLLVPVATARAQTLDDLAGGHRVGAEMSVGTIDSEGDTTGNAVMALSLRGQLARAPNLLVFGVVPFSLFDSEKADETHGLGNVTAGVRAQHVAPDVSFGFTAAVSALGQEDGSAGLLLTIHEDPSSWLIDDGALALR